FIVFLIGLNLIFDTYPTVSFELLGKVDSRYRIGKAKEEFIRVFVTIQTLFDKIDFVRKHFFKSGFGNITTVIFHTINSIAKVFVISRHSLSNGSRRTTGSKEMPNCFLTSSNFGKCSVNIKVSVDAKRFVFNRRDSVNFSVPFKNNLCSQNTVP